jgi:hypothetical protein
LKIKGLVDFWHDRDICAGDDWHRVIDERLKRCNVVLLLISPDFLASEYCMSCELDHVRARLLRNEIIAIQVLLRPIPQNAIPIPKLQCTPSREAPVSKWEDTEDAFARIAEDIEKKILSQFGIAQQASWPRPIHQLSYFRIPAVAAATTATAVATGVVCLEAACARILESSGLTGYHASSILRTAFVLGGASGVTTGVVCMLESLFRRSK